MGHAKFSLSGVANGLFFLGWGGVSWLCYGYKEYKTWHTCEKLIFLA